MTGLGGAAPIARRASRIDKRRIADMWRHCPRATSSLAVEAMTAPLIDLANVSLTLGEGEVRTHILKSVSLRLDPGESVAVLGPSGSGKSSLMAVIAGLERPDAGRVELGGEDLGP